MYQKVNLMHLTRMPEIKHLLNEKPIYFNKVKLFPYYYFTCSKWKHGIVTNSGSERLIITSSDQEPDNIKENHKSDALY